MDVVLSDHGGVFQEGDSLLTGFSLTDSIVIDAFLSRFSYFEDDSESQSFFIRKPFSNGTRTSRKQRERVTHLWQSSTNARSLM